jgi:hypothetical protein
MKTCTVCTSPCEHETALCGDCWINECPYPEIQCAECQGREELLTQYRETCQEIFNLQIPVAAGCDKLAAISNQLDHIVPSTG